MVFLLTDATWLRRVLCVWSWTNAPWMSRVTHIALGPLWPIFNCIVGFVCKWLLNTRYKWTTTVLKGLQQQRSTWVQDHRRQLWSQFKGHQPSQTFKESFSCSPRITGFQSFSVTFHVEPLEVISQENWTTSADPSGFPPVDPLEVTEILSPDPVCKPGFPVVKRGKLNWSCTVTRVQCYKIKS